MRSLIAIAVGAYILLSGNEIGVLVNVSYISLITNLVGVLLIVWGVKGLVEYNAAEMRKREQHYDTIKSMLEKISLDSQTRDIQKQLTQIYDEQLNYMQISKNMMAVFGRIETVIRRTDESVFQIHQTNISQIEFLKKITQDIKSLEETNTKDIEAVKLALKNMNHDLHMDYVEFKSRIEELERGKIMELKYFREMPAHIMELESSFIDKIENKKDSVKFLINYSESRELKKDDVLNFKEMESKSNLAILEVKHRNEADSKKYGEEFHTYDKVDFTIILDDGKDFGIYLDNREDIGDYQSFRSFMKNTYIDEFKNKIINMVNEQEESEEDEL